MNFINHCITIALSCLLCGFSLELVLQGRILFVFRCCRWGQRYDLDWSLPRKPTETIEHIAHTVVWMDFSFCASFSNSYWAEKPSSLSFLKYLCIQCYLLFFLLPGVSISPCCCCIFLVITDTGRCFLHPKLCNTSFQPSSSALTVCPLILLSTPEAVFLGAGYFWTAELPGF